MGQCSSPQQTRFIEMIISAERIAGLQNESANKQTGEYEQRVECRKVLAAL